jgi:hypothetical protein
VRRFSALRRVRKRRTAPHSKTLARHPGRFMVPMRVERDVEAPQDRNTRAIKNLPIDGQASFSQSRIK